MNRAEYEVLAYNAFLKRTVLSKRKGQDYADEDVLANFKRMAAVSKIWGVNVTTPAGCAEYLAILKLDRYFNLKAQGKDPANESLDDTFMDLMNYLGLLVAILHEDTALAQLEDIET